jgi:hypothetical protein
LSAKERERLKVLQQVEEGHLRQVDAARAAAIGRGRRSNHKIPESLWQRAMRQLRQARYAGFGPALASEHLARSGMVVSRETLRHWMSRAGLWHLHRRQVKAVHVWQPRRSAFGELVMMDSSPFRWLEDRGPAGHLIALIDDATSRVWADWWSTTPPKRTCARWAAGWNAMGDRWSCTPIKTACS